MAKLAIFTTIHSSLLSSLSSQSSLSSLLSSLSSQSSLSSLSLLSPLSRRPPWPTAAAGTRWASAGPVWQRYRQAAMGGSAAAVLNRLIQNAACPKNTSAAANHASRIIAHLDFGDLQRTISTLASAPAALLVSLYARLLQVCSARCALVQARSVESHVVPTSTHPSTFLFNRAIETYANCGSLKDARELFDKMPRRDGSS